MALTIFGGSLEFVAVSMLLSPFAPLQTFLVALMIQARHLFYGIAMLDKFKGLGWKRWYLIFGMCDETFSINYSAKIPARCGSRLVYVFCDRCSNQFYWVSGSTIGGLAGNLINFNTPRAWILCSRQCSSSFSLEQLLKERKHYTAIIGLAASLGCLIFFGAGRFP